MAGFLVKTVSRVCLSETVSHALALFFSPGVVLKHQYNRSARVRQNLARGISKKSQPAVPARTKRQVQETEQMGGPREANN